MKLPFFNVKIAHRSLGKAFNAARINIIENLEKQLPLPEGLLSIHFTFSTCDLAHSVHFAACLNCMNIEILYPTGPNNCKQLLCKSLKIKPDVEIIKQTIIETAEKALKHGYSLDQWRIESDHIKPWYGGLVVKTAGMTAEDSF